MTFATLWLSWQDLPSRLRRSVMSADYIGLETNLRRCAAMQVQNLLISEQKRAPL